MKRIRFIFLITLVFYLTLTTIVSAESGRSTLLNIIGNRMISVFDPMGITGYIVNSYTSEPNLENYERLNPYDADVSVCYSWSGDRYPTTGEGHAKWFDWNGCANNKYYEVVPGKELIFRTRTDSASCQYPDFTIFEYQDGQWVTKEIVDLQNGPQLNQYFNYTTSSDKIRIYGGRCFYLFIYSPVQNNETTCENVCMSSPSECSAHCSSLGKNYECSTTSDCNCCCECTTDITAEYCGDGVVSSGESCDIDLKYYLYPILGSTDSFMSVVIRDANGDDVWETTVMDTKIIPSLNLVLHLNSIRALSDGTVVSADITVNNSEKGTILAECDNINATVPCSFTSVSQCSLYGTKCDYSERKYCEIDGYGDCDSDCQCSYDSWDCGSVDGSSYCTNCFHCGDGECNCGETSDTCISDCDEESILNLECPGICMASSAECLESGGECSVASSVLEIDWDVDLESTDISEESVALGNSDDSINSITVDSDDFYYKYKFKKQVNLSSESSKGDMSSPQYQYPVGISLLGKSFEIVAVESDSILMLVGEHCSHVNATSVCEYGDYKIYTGIGVSSFVELKVEDADGNIIAEETVTGWTTGSSVTKTFDSLNLEVTITSILGSYDGSVANVDMVVGPVGSTIHRYDSDVDIEYRSSNSNDAFPGTDRWGIIFLGNDCSDGIIGADSEIRVIYYPISPQVLYYGDTLSLPNDFGSLTIDSKSASYNCDVCCCVEQTIEPNCEFNAYLDKDKFNEGDYITIHTESAESGFVCDYQLISPDGDEFFITNGSVTCGGLGWAYSFNTDVYLDSPGSWRIRVHMNRLGCELPVQYLDFEYGNYTADRNITACAADVKECPDGTFVSRNPDNDCEFYECPVVSEEDVENGDIDCESGCLYDGNCLSIGIRREGKYCSFDGDMVTQKGGDDECENNFECRSNVCVNNECMSQSLIQRIISQLMIFFRLQ